MTAPLAIDGCDAALLGVGERCGQPPLLVYDYDLLLTAFEAQGMTPEEAEEWIGFNVAGAWMGEGTPLILYRGSREDVEEHLT